MKEIIYFDADSPVDQERFIVYARIKIVIFAIIGTTAVYTLAMSIIFASMVVLLAADSPHSSNDDPPKPFPVAAEPPALESDATGRLRRTGMLMGGISFGICFICIVLVTMAFRLWRRDIEKFLLKTFQSQNVGIAFNPVVPTIARAECLRVSIIVALLYYITLLLLALAGYISASIR